MSDLTDNYDIFKPKDLEIYNELRDQVTTVPIKQGAYQIYGDKLCFQLVGKTAEQIARGDNLLTPIYKMRQVLARKKTGTGDDIAAGDNVYLYPTDKRISSNKIGTAGTDFYFCGTAKFDATASESTIVIEFDGTRYTEDV